MTPLQLHLFNGLSETMTVPASVPVASQRPSGPKAAQVTMSSGARPWPAQCAATQPPMARSHSTPSGPALTTGDRPGSACCSPQAWLWPQRTSRGPRRSTASRTAALPGLRPSTSDITRRTCNAALTPNGSKTLGPDW